MSEAPDTVVIVNPQSRSGRTGREYDALQNAVRSELGNVRIHLTERPGHARELAHRAAQAGLSRIVVAGGDGTVNEVLNGLLALDGARPELGLLPMGTGRDFARLLALGSDFEASLARLKAGQRRRVDAGKITYRDPEGLERSRYFLNIASFGLTGESALWLEERGKQGKRGSLSYVMSGLVGLSRYDAPGYRMRVDGEPLCDEPLLLAAVANGQYFAGGMHVAPDAKIDDGLFDVIAVPKLSTLRGLLEFPSLMRGTHVKLAGVKVRRGRVVEVESDGPVWIEADGEVIGTLPARFELVPSAITLCGLP